MSDYTAPLADMRFALNEIAGLQDLGRLSGEAEATPEIIDQVLSEAGRFAAGVLAPLNEIGDRQGSRIENGVVRTPDGFADAYARFVAGGWNGVAAAPEHGGHGLPLAVATAVGEMWTSANMSLALCPLLTQAAIKLLGAHGSETQKQMFLDKLVSGEWSGTMCMTEPQAGSDVGALSTRAVRAGDHYLLTGTKTFITYGEHDMAENIVHMVLARTPDAAPGVRGISLFVVPKFLPGDSGLPGPRNDLRALSLEHKLGINASPTCVMAFGEGEGAVGYLIGEENRGIEYMFTMMNTARLDIGLQGVAIAERAYQRARAFAAERQQGRRLGDGAPARIIEHPDVRRMLLTMKAQIEATRALVYRVAADIDLARGDTDGEVRAARQRRVDLLTPVVKAYVSETGFEMTSLGLQVHGGMGYIEETGAAQHLRDARIAMIYEGTNGIQALDLARRKLQSDNGQAVREFLAEIHALDVALSAGGEALAPIRAPLADGAKALGKATDWLLDTWPDDPCSAAAGASEYLRMFGLIACGAMMAQSAIAAARRLKDGGDTAFCRSKLATARFFAERILPQASALLGPMTSGAAALAALDDTVD